MSVKNMGIRLTLLGLFLYVFPVLTAFSGSALGKNEGTNLRSRVFFLSLSVPLGIPEIVF